LHFNKFKFVLLIFFIVLGIKGIRALHFKQNHYAVRHLGYTYDVTKDIHMTSHISHLEQLLPGHFNLNLIFNSCPFEIKTQTVHKLACEQAL
jgi:hypothetical protein